MKKFKLKIIWTLVLIFSNTFNSKAQNNSIEGSWRLIYNNQNISLVEYWTFFEDEGSFVNSVYIDSNFVGTYDGEFEHSENMLSITMEGSSYTSDYQILFEQDLLQFEISFEDDTFLFEKFDAILGCTDPNALNFDSMSTLNIGSCEYEDFFIDGTWVMISENGWNVDPLYLTFFPDSGNVIGFEPNYEEGTFDTYSISFTVNENNLSFDAEETASQMTLLSNQLILFNDDGVYVFEQVETIIGCSDPNDPAFNPNLNLPDPNSCDNNEFHINHVGISSSRLIKIIDLLGREYKEPRSGILLFYIYDNGEIEKRIIH